mmetsp:Transcript_15867/g.47643  ORF Transcript_15867/g.47643 Transcript_15867/m.47643 type:complete len:209 (+) Transcript_15867:6519-7145(+)
MSWSSSAVSRNDESGTTASENWTVTSATRSRSLPCGKHETTVRGVAEPFSISSLSRLGTGSCSSPAGTGASTFLCTVVCLLLGGACVLAGRKNSGVRRAACKKDLGRRERISLRSSAERDGCWAEAEREPPTRRVLGCWAVRKNCDEWPRVEEPGRGMLTGCTKTEMGSLALSFRSLSSSSLTRKSSPWSRFSVSGRNGSPSRFPNCS